MVDRRALLLSGIATAAASLLARPASALAPFALGQATDESAIDSALPVPQPGQWIDYVMGFGVAYLKQIGFGEETGSGAPMLYVETQNGVPGGTCNPNTVKKTYLRSSSFGKLFDVMPALLHVARQDYQLITWGDEPDPKPGEDELRLLDLKALYDSRACTVTALGEEMVAVGVRRLSASHLACRYPAADGTLATLDLWTSPLVPLGVVKISAAIAGLGPFDLRVQDYGSDFTTALTIPFRDLKKFSQAA
ncbi:MAG: hypothetical protein ACREM8_01335 [Vulcanimicrobiaceae bacterium]